MRIRPREHKTPTGAVFRGGVAPRARASGGGDVKSSPRTLLSGSHWQTAEYANLRLN